MSGDFTFLKGNIETIILCSLYNRDKYGYEIAKDIKDRTENAYEIKQPTLYSYLKRLQDDGLIESYWGTESNGGRRRYYMLTKYGRQSCVKFISEWEFQRGVLSNLVDGTADSTDVSQEDVTPLFGRRSQKRRRSPEEDALQRQQDIAGMLDMLDGGVSQSDENQDNSDQQQDTVVEEAPETDDTQVVEDTSSDTTEQNVATDDIADNTVAATQAAENDVVADLTDATATTATQTDPEPPVDDGNPIPPQTSVEDARARFVFRQDDADSFIQDFDRRAQGAMGTVAPQEPNYQHVLMGVIGNQLDDASQVQSATPDFDTMEIDGRPVQLEQVADSLAQEGIRLRIYNHATANYKPKALMPVSKVVCTSSWITYAFAAVFFGILIALSVPTASWLPFVITLSVITLAPVTLSVIAFVDNSRKDKPDFPYRTVQIVTLILAFIVVLVSLSVNLFGNIQLGNFVEVSTKILIPTGVAVLPALFVFVFNYFYKKY